MPVPNTNTFSLTDVTTEIAGTQNDLSACFTDADPNGFDPLYEGSKDRLSNFRNYNDNPSTLTIFPQSRTSPAGGDSFTITITTTGSPAWTQSDNAAWVAASPASGTGNGSVSVLVDGNLTGSTRFAVVSISWSGPTRSCSITQNP